MSDNANKMGSDIFLLTPLREGRHDLPHRHGRFRQISTHAPAGGATGAKLSRRRYPHISTHAPAGGATEPPPSPPRLDGLFLLTPLREGRRRLFLKISAFSSYFYSRPCGRGDATLCAWRMGLILFLLTPLREGRLNIRVNNGKVDVFLLTPLREGRPGTPDAPQLGRLFLLTPLREGRPRAKLPPELGRLFLLTPLREGRQQFSTSPS